MVNTAPLNLIGFSKEVTAIPNRCYICYGEANYWLADSCQWLCTYHWQEYFNKKETNV